MQGSLLASLGRPLWRLLDANKVNANELFKRHGLDPALVQEARSRYPFEAVCSAWVEAAGITGNPRIGLQCGAHYSPMDLNALGVTFLSSGNLLDALQRVVRYESVLNTGMDFAINENAERVELTFATRVAQGDALRIMEDARTSVLVDLCRAGFDGALDPLEIAFSYPEPTDIGEYFGVLRCPLSFSQTPWRLAFRAADAMRPFTSATRELALANDAVLDSMLKELGNSDLVSQVKRAIIHDLPSGAPVESDVASQLCVSSRTLQRKLAEENTGFRNLLLEVRRELAEKYILDKHMPLAEISYLLGFADMSSFSRAFKKWTGEPPAAFRANALD